MKLKNNLLIHSFFMLVLLCCNPKSAHKVKSTEKLEAQDTTEWVHTCQTYTPVEQLQKNVILYGDAEAYWELRLKYMEMSMDESLLPYSLIMANKYDYPIAYFDVYNWLTLLSYWHSPNHTFDLLDKKTLSLAIEYLKRGSQKGETNCMRNLGYLYEEGKYVKKDTVLGKQLIEKSRKKKKSNEKKYFTVID
jgi:hypothetical protein